MGTGLDDRSPQRLHPTALEEVDNAICAALADVEAEGARRALSDALTSCAATGTTVPPQVVACVESAGEHIGYSEWTEARMLLTVSHRLLSRVRPEMVLPAPSTPGDVALSR